MDHLIFEETQSCLYQSNDGRLVYDHSLGPVNTFVVLLDGVEVFATHYRFAVDAYIAGYDAARSHHYTDGKGVEDEALAQEHLREIGVSPSEASTLLAVHAISNPLAPPGDLADAWARFQRGEEITPAELRKLDEWRADVREEVLGW